MPPFRTITFKSITRIGQVLPFIMASLTVVLFVKINGFVQEVVAQDTPPSAQEGGAASEPESSANASDPTSPSTPASPPSSPSLAPALAPDASGLAGPPQDPTQPEGTASSGPSSVDPSANPQVAAPAPLVNNLQGFVIGGSGKGLDLLELSPEKIQALQSLSQRSADIAQREKDLSQQEAYVKALEQRLNQKEQNLSKLLAESKGLLEQISGKENDQLTKIGQVFQKMKPKQAAERLAALSVPHGIIILGQLKPNSIAPILSFMDPNRAKELATKLVENGQMSQLTSLPPALQTTSPSPSPSPPPASTTPSEAPPAETLPPITPPSPATPPAPPESAAPVRPLSPPAPPSSQAAAAAPTA